jgi:urease accessory protein
MIGGTFDAENAGWSSTVLSASLAVVMTIALAGAAHAHTGEGVQGGLVSGLTHPLFGWDHVVAMVAVGLWGVFLGRPAIWILPVVFPLVMAFGGAMGVAGMPLPAVEAGIALSGVILGLLVAFGARAPLWAAAALVGSFAIFHGHAHGTELPDAASPYAYAVGFVVATGLLHLSGIAFGALGKRPWGGYAVRAAGLVIAAVGAAYLTGLA